MTAGRSEHRPVKIRRRGRHTAPSQVEKVAEKAGKAAPAMAIAGALVAAPQAQHAFIASAKPGTAAAADTHWLAGARQQGTPQADATAALDSVTSHSVVVRTASTARHAATAAPARNTYYTVRSGDTLSGIAEDYYHNASDWQWLYHENDKTVSDPNLIYPGQTLFVPADPPANYTLPNYTNYVPKHAAPTTPVTTTTTSPGDSDGDGGAGNSGGSGGTVTVQSASQGGSGSTTGGGQSSGGGSTTLSGTLSCSGLEQLWDTAGGNPADAFMAAEIAMAESGGDQYALSPTDDYGYWQINASHGALATFNPLGNAQAAIQISGDGTNWTPWTTYNTGAYAGKC
jgi:LysM repeat protein